MRGRGVQSQPPRINVPKLLDSDLKSEKKRAKKKIDISRVRVRKLLDSESEEEKIAISSVCDSNLLGSDSEEEKAEIFRVGDKKILDSELEEEKIAISSVRVFPSMPTVGTRRSTRIFVPKSITKTNTGADLSPARVLRSGKRLRLESAATEKLPGGADCDGDDELLRWWKGERFGTPHGCDEPLLECNPATAGTVCEPPAVIPEPTLAVDDSSNQVNRMFGIVYSRKRWRRSTTGSVDSDKVGVSRDPKYGIPFVRKQRRKKQFVGEKLDGFAFEYDLGWNQKSYLLVSVESRPSSLRHFICFLGLVLSWMRKSRLKLWQFIAFLLSESVASVFSLHGIQFESLPSWSSAFHLHCRGSNGICMIYGARRFVPLVSFNFAALPSYFMGLHSSMHFWSFYHHPVALSRFLVGSYESSRGTIICSEQCDSCVPMEMGNSENEIICLGIPSAKKNTLPPVVEAAETTDQNVVLQHGTRFRKHQKKRSSSRSIRTPKNSSSANVVIKFNSVSKVPTAQNDFFRVRDVDTAPSSPRAYLRQRSFRNSPVEKTKELKSALVGLKQNMDSASCNANILVIQSDRCWREEGAEVLLECSGSKEWCLAVKIQGSVRYHHKAQEMKPSTFNRYTHSMMWAGESGWKLEFCDRKDWLIFKELHKECCERNVQVACIKIIPIPGVQEVLDYVDGEQHVPFLRPDAYITVRNDEVERALTCNNACYDMDSEDELCLERLNYSFDSDVHVSPISVDSFEKIIFSFEKAAYSHPNDVSDADKATDLCADLGRGDMVAAVYEHWLRKRKRKQLALVRFFQGPPPKRAQLIPKPFFRKKRSFKRQASRVGGRGKPESFLQAEVEKEVLEKEALDRVHEAQRAADNAIESAILKRRKAQVLMQNSDLATYRAVMALRFAEAAQLADDGTQLLDSELNIGNGEVQ